MKIDVSRKFPEHFDTLILIHEEGANIQDLDFIGDELKQSIQAFVDAEDFKFKKGQMSAFSYLHKNKREQVILCGAGKSDELDSMKTRELFANCWRYAFGKKAKQIYVLMGFEPIINDVILGHVLAESALLSEYKFDKYQKKEEDAFANECIHLLLATKNTRHINRGILEGRILAEATNLARDLVNEPPNLMTPDVLAEHAKKAALQYGFSIDVFSADKLRRLKMEALLAVGKGSKVDPKLIILRYTGNPDKKQAVTALVGKGLTFDSGGYCIKPGPSMVGMKSDMAGSAAVIGAMAAISTLKLKVNVVGIIAAAENMINGEAYRPGDIVTAMSGKTIEVINTDAEGRLTLVDAIHYALEKEKVERVLDIATLTGAAAAALGSDFSVVLGNDEAWMNQLRDASAHSGERIWELPLHEPYKELVKSEVADIKNVGGRMAGAITAALFIEAFVQGKPWIHIDIAGSSMNERPKGILSHGATGVGVRLLTNLMKIME